VARERSQAPVLALTSSIDTARQLALVWGVHAVETSEFDNMSEMVNRACLISRAEGFAEPGQRLMIVAGVPFGAAGTTNTIRIAFVPT
jgi:pyruvate kinase